MNTRIPVAVWRISEAVREERRVRLTNSPEFLEIVKSLSVQCERVTLRREPCRGDLGYFRAVAVLSFKSEFLVDAFHNSSSGYRAQYLASIEAGERSNEFVANVFRDLVVSRLNSRFPYSWDRDWAEASIEHSGAKVWIHQGTWLRFAREECNDLQVETWQASRKSSNADDRKKARFGRILPENVGAIDFKGVWVKKSEGLCLVRDSFKPNRAHAIHHFGFT